LVLTGVSQAAYLGKKVLVGQSPEEEQQLETTVRKHRQASE
jgi:hypothetical protein